ncbi:hypothetical cytosolic protein [Syntrophus aciditrophicus SB]|uniref:Hypothetical cytosolic protein n=1 Tax=Syntrophus aciditrophicus (strain SB) TaxID=56780 RepID=Q2LS78_SYNAS|nr:hypothetical cytosolic protein [Syntrophus aciditrophicus SB]
MGSEIRGKSHKASFRSPGPILQAHPAPETVSVRRGFGESSIGKAPVLLLFSCVSFIPAACSRRGKKRIAA